MSKIAGIDNALKMRQMFIDDGSPCSFYCSEGYSGIVAIITIYSKEKLFEFSYYFREDGTYYRGSN